jgi:hypothetical protein
VIFFVKLPSPEHRAHFIQVLPTLLKDIIDKADRWGNDGESGRIDPFIEIFDVTIFPTTYIFSGHCAELSFPDRFLHDNPYGYMSRFDE